ncbi:hypothetical protein [Thioalkalivibrio thiocyanodenitrificans]|uniref:hypothetical protein n=1 Tax=Thioalkalivibrio thiocyanodenitrificans TaxID=243063 RepID=UPI0003672CD5|nr:hypothetical protein [Thioalkalivibrio thiocyanodenitrificans]
MPTFSFYLGNSSPFDIVYRWDGFCTDFNHVEGQDTFSGTMWLRDGVRLVNGTSDTALPDFPLTLTMGSYDEGASFATFDAVGGMTITEPDVTRGTFTGATSLTVTSATFSGTFMNADTMTSGYVVAWGDVLYASPEGSQGADASSSFTWVRNLPACTPF